MPAESAPESACPLAFPLAEIPADQLEAYRRVLRLESVAPDDVRRELRELHASRARVLEVLSHLPPFCCCLLEILFECGGRLNVPPLLELARERTELAPKQASAFIHQTVAYGFAVRLETKGAFGRIESLALIDSAAPVLGDLVSGITLPKAPPPSDATAAGISESERALLSLATFTGHRRIRVNRDLSANLGSLKTAVKGLGLDPELAQDLLARAQGRRLVRRRLDAFAPAAGELERAARLGLRGSGLEDRLRAWLTSTEWTPLEQFLRELVREELERGRGRAHWFNGVRDQRDALGEITARDLEVRRHLGHEWVRRRDGELLRSGDGHVTPNLEVYLGPHAHPEIIVRVGLGAELVRLDKVLTFRITPASVSAGLLSGLTVEAFLEALAFVGPRGLDEAVRLSVLDFSRRMKVAQARSGWVLRLAEGVAELFVQKHPELVLERLSPELILVTPALDAAPLQKHLKALGVELRLPDGERGEEAGSRPAVRERAHPLPPPRALSGSADPELRRRLEQDRLGGFAESRRRQAELTSPAEALEMHERVKQAIHSDARALSPDLAELLSRADKLVAGLKGELDSYIKTLGHEERQALEADMSFSLALLPYVVLRPEWRAKARKRAARKGSLADAAAELVSSSRATPSGYRLILDARHPERRREVAALLRALPEIIETARRESRVALSPSSLGSHLELPASFVDDDDFNDDDFNDDDFNDDDFDDDELDQGSAAPGRSELAGTGIAPRLSGKLRSPPPLADEFPELAREAVEARLSEAVRSGELIFVRANEGARTSIHALLPERIARRGDTKLLLAVDPDTDEGRALDVSKIESVLRSE